MYYPEPIERLIENLTRLPGIGRKTATRLAFFLLNTRDSYISELSKNLMDIKEKIRLIVKELKLTAKSEDVKVVEKYLDLWEPVEFITRSEAKKMIERAIDEKFK